LNKHKTKNERSQPKPKWEGVKESVSIEKYIYGIVVVVSTGLPIGGKNQDGGYT